MNNILHITHTDINCDSRILKEMNSLTNKNNKLVGIGVKLDEGNKNSNMEQGFEIISVSLFSRKFRFLPNFVRHFLTLFELTLKVFFKALKVKPNVIHCHDTLVLPLGILLKLFTGAKVVYDAHELESDKNGLSKPLSVMTFYLEKILWRYVDYLIVVSPSIKEWYNTKIGHKPTEIILNSPVGISSEQSKSNYLRETFNISDDSKIFLYIGILGKGRGIELLCDVFKNSTLNSSLVFLGYGDLYNDIKDIEKSCDNIFLHDAVAHEQVVNVAKSADFGMCLIENVSLSDYYCLPNKLFEYCLSGVPVIASKFPDIEHIITEYDLGFCCELDVNSVTDVIKSIEINKMSITPSNKDLYQLTWEYQSEKLNKLYRSL